MIDSKLQPSDSELSHCPSVPDCDSDPCQYPGSVVMASLLGSSDHEYSRLNHLNQIIVILMGQMAVTCELLLDTTIFSS